MKTIKHFNSLELFTTRHLLARKVNLNEVNAALSKRALLALLEWPVDSEKRYTQLDEWMQNQFGFWQFFLKDSNTFFGCGGFASTILNEYQEVEFIYSFSHELMDRQIAQYMVNACVELAQEKLHLANLVCFTPINDSVVRALIKEAGFVFEEVVNINGVSYELNRLKKPLEVVVVPYNPRWPAIYAQEAHLIKNALGGNLKEIYHIGSTAIANMVSKPVIDLLLECESLDETYLMTWKLNTLGYPALRRHVVPHRSYFMRKEDHDLDFHLHIREKGDPQIRRYINFRQQFPPPHRLHSSRAL